MAAKTGRRVRTKTQRGSIRPRLVDASVDARDPAVTQRILPPGIHSVRAVHIRECEHKWVNGTTLHYHFFNRSEDGENGAWIGPAAQKAVVRKAFQAWKDAGIGLEFCEVPNREDAELRIGFCAADGCWSFVGRDAIDVARDTGERTMNLAGDLTTRSGWRQALLHVGLALGLRGADALVARQPSAGEFLPDEAVREAQLFYPPLATAPEPELLPGCSRVLALAPGEQASFRLRPQITRTYTIRTFGPCDAVMVLFEEINAAALYEEMDGETEFLAGCDDSGTDTNGTMRLRLFRDREYILRIRVAHRNFSRESGVLFW